MIELASPNRGRRHLFTNTLGEIGVFAGADQIRDGQCEPPRDDEAQTKIWCMIRVCARRTARDALSHVVDSHTATAVSGQCR